MIDDVNKKKAPDHKMFVKGIHYISDLRYVYFLKPIECLRDRCKNLLDILHMEFTESEYI